MPTVLTVGPYQFLFFSSDRSEPPHIHVKRDRQVAKFWLDPVALARNRSFADHEIHRMERLVAEHRDFLIAAWHAYFDS